MGEMNVEDMKLYLDDPQAARAKADADRLDMLALTADQLVGYLSSLVCEADAAVLTGELAEAMISDIQHGLAPGADGWWDDAEAEFGDWGFELSSIVTPVLLLHGRQDRFVPFGHGEWLAAHIPGVEARLTDDDGHLTLTGHHLEEIHAWLLERMGR
jgi:pimeloyl-ACP methyl ester carboxylesterase